jgi:diadenylate cyclase
VELINAFSLKDALEVLLLSVVIYRLMLLIHGTRAMQMIVGLLIIFGISFAALKLEFHTISWLFSNLLTVLLMAVIILFQPELRRALAAMGRTPGFGNLYSPSKAHALEELVRAAVSLAGRRVGALMVIQRETELANYVEGGTPLDARLSRELLTCIFMPVSPLHDGAVLVKEDRLLIAGAFLPLSLDPNLGKDLGTRHRAAVGISEETDAVVVVVSEESGNISIAREGVLERNLEVSTLRERLRTHILPKGKGN